VPKERKPGQTPIRKPASTRERPDIPWLFPIRRETQDAIEFKLFEKDRKGGGFAGGGAVEVQVFLDGAWHWMKFATDGEGYRKLAALPDRSRALLLDALVLGPVRGNLLPTTGKKRARGSSKRDAGFWLNVDYWGPGLQAWTVDALAQEEKPATLRRVLTAAKKARLHTGKPEEIAAALCVLAWAALHTVNPGRFPSPGGKNIQAAITARTSTKTSPYQHGIWPPMKAFIDAVLSPGKQAQRLRQHVPVLCPPEEFDPSVFMTDFRIA
jgi:hypothetical protein